MARAKKTTETGRCFVIEIGIDGYVAPRHDGTYPHLMSLVEVTDYTAETGTAAWFTGFNSGDQIAFRACDYTESTIGAPEIDVKGIFASFLEPEHPGQVSKCVNDGDGVICSGQDYFPRLESGSLVTKGQPCWRFVGPGPNGTKEKSFLLTGQHRALLRVSIAATVEVGSIRELRWYTHDPEIIVGEGSGSEGQGRRHAPRRRKGY